MIYTVKLYDSVGRKRKEKRIWLRNDMKKIIAPNPHSNRSEAVFCLQSKVPHSLSTCIFYDGIHELLVRIIALTFNLVTQRNLVWNSIPWRPTVFTVNSLLIWWETTAVTFPWQGEDLLKGVYCNFRGAHWTDVPNASLGPNSLQACFRQNVVSNFTLYTLTTG